MKTKTGQYSAEVPQYEEYRTGSCMEAVLQWLGGIGLIVLAVWCWLWPGNQGQQGSGVFVLAGLLLMLFLVPFFRGRSRTKENQEICRRNRRKYDCYRSSLKEAGEME